MAGALARELGDRLAVALEPAGDYGERTGRVLVFDPRSGRWCSGLAAHWPAHVKSWGARVKAAWGAEALTDDLPSRESEKPGPPSGSRVDGLLRDLQRLGNVEPERAEKAIIGHAAAGAGIPLEGEPASTWPIPTLAAQDLDRPGYLGFGEHVLRLADGAVLAGEDARTAYVTRTVGLPTFDPDARHPAVDRVLATGPDVAYLMRAAGYALRGRPSRRIYAVVGPPATGKSTVLAAVQGALGDYAGTCPAEALSLEREKRGTGHDSAIAAMATRHLAMTPELTVRVSASAMKRYSGGDPLAVRPAYSRLVRTVTPRVTLFLAANDGSLPSLGAADPGMAERLRCVRLPEIAEPDPMLREELATEPARLALVAALVAGQMGATDAPADIPSVTAATESLIAADLSGLDGWIAANVIPSPGGALGATEAYHAALEAAKADGDAPDGKPWGASVRTFGKALTRRCGPPTDRKRIAGVQQHVRRGWVIRGEPEQGALEPSAGDVAETDTPTSATPAPHCEGCYQTQREGCASACTVGRWRDAAADATAPDAAAETDTAGEWENRSGGRARALPGGSWRTECGEPGCGRHWTDPAPSDGSRKLASHRRSEHGR